MITLALALQIAAGAPMNTDSILSSIQGFVRVSERLATSGQPTTEHIAAIANDGFHVVINLAPARAERNGHEGFAVAEHGMTYVNIPVSWEAPAIRDLEMFFAVMDANRDRKVYVHCFANMRASAFTYLYRTLVDGEDEQTARRDMEVVWDPSADEQWTQWRDFLTTAKRRIVR